MKLNGLKIFAALCAIAVSAQASASPRDGAEDLRLSPGLETAEPTPGPKPAPKPAPAPAQAPAPAPRDKAETAKIEALLTQLETLKEATFIRNDVVMQPKEAAALMRKKLQSMPKEIKTANDFIEKIMTASSSGAKKPYLLRFKDGKETKCADYLKAELKKLETKPADGK